MPTLTFDDGIRIARSCETTGAFALARQLYGKILSADPGNARATAALAEVDMREQRFRNFESPPNDALLELTNLLKAKEYKRLLAQSEALRARFPDDCNLLILEGSANRFLTASKPAEAAFRRLTELYPEDRRGYEYLGDILSEQLRPEEALAAYRQALELAPQNPKLICNCLVWRAHLCDWDAFDELDELFRMKSPIVDSLPPFNMLALRDDLEDHGRRSREHGARLADPRAQQMPATAKREGERIRVGYFSADFRDHPVLQQVSGLFREHDRTRFEVFAYSLGGESDSALRTQLKQDVEHFVDVHGRSPEELVALARGDALDIAVDMMGYTINAPTLAFAARMAPIQVNYLGYPGTTGAPFMDYIVADKVLIPPQSAAAYSEQPLYLPNSFMPADNTRKIAGPSQRSDHGLPDGAFVFCSFNQAYKIGPREFDIWMRLLKNVEGSVLWLKQPRDIAWENLLREAAKRGIGEERFVLARKLPHPEHLERHRHADLFLDTFNYNGHSTTSEALWAGLPVVTKAGEQFSARVAASLVTAAGLPELVATSEEEYEALILELAGDSGRLAEITARLRNNRDTSPLFDTRQYARDLEAVYERAFELQVSHVRGD